MGRKSSRGGWCLRPRRFLCVGNTNALTICVMALTAALALAFALHCFTSSGTGSEVEGGGVGHLRRAFGDVIVGHGEDDEPCVDDKPMCVGWAKEGECRANPEYMLVSCRLSCGVCITTPAAPAGDGAGAGAVGVVGDGMKEENDAPPSVPPVPEKKKQTASSVATSPGDAYLKPSAEWVRRTPPNLAEEGFPLPKGYVVSEEWGPPPRALETQQGFIGYLNERFAEMSADKTGVRGHDLGQNIWETYHDATMAYVLQEENDPHADNFRPGDAGEDTMFVTLTSFRDKQCPRTMRLMFENAARPEKLSVGLLQQNCYENCKGGALEGGVIPDVEPDVECLAEFCAEGSEFRKYCESGQIISMRISEDEAMGPCFARYLASRLWRGEAYFMQIDAHMGFAEGWDAKLIDQLAKAPSDRPVISHYPPQFGNGWQDQIGLRMCDAKFTGASESNTVRMQPSVRYDKTQTGVPHYAPYIAAGFFVAPAAALLEVPFDPFLPWLFMGEELMLSVRFFTNGWDIFSPSHNVISHEYVRKYTPKFWGAMGRFFHAGGIHNQLQKRVIARVKNVCGYPEGAREKLAPEDVGFVDMLDRFGPGTAEGRTVAVYMDMAGLDTAKQVNNRPQWCHDGEPPPFYTRGSLL